MMPRFTEAHNNNNNNNSEAGKAGQSIRNNVLLRVKLRAKKGNFTIGFCLRRHKEEERKTNNHHN